LPRHEHQDVSHGGLQVYLDYLPHSTFYVVFTRVAAKENIHWECAARDLGGGGREGGWDRGGEGDET